MSDNLRQLVKNCLAGNQQSMLELVERFEAPVFGLCYRMLGHRQDAEDVVQETFLRVLRSLHRWDPQRDFMPWLLAIAANRCRTALARRSRRPAVQPLGAPVADPAEPFQSAYVLAEEIERALQEVRPEHREAFLLFHSHHLSYAQIAEALQCPLGTVKTRVHRARMQLIERLRSRGVLGEERHAVRGV